MNTLRFIMRAATLAVFVASAIGASAQTVDFNQHRTFATTADRLVYDVDGSKLVGTNYVALVYYEATEGVTSLTPVAQFNRFRNVPTTDALAGTWVAATRTLTGRMAGDNVTLQVKVWDQVLFPTFEIAQQSGGIWGESATFTYTIPAPGSLPSAFYIENFRAFSLVPEPSSIALGILGALAVLVLRRRRAR
jgi:hypothetical protein